MIPIPKRIIAISDIHGCYDAWMKLLTKVNYDPACDLLILGGDYCDRGLQNIEVIEEAIRLQKQHNIIALLGNHDQMILDACFRDDPEYRAEWATCGGLKTVENYVGSTFAQYGWDEVSLGLAIESIHHHYVDHLNFLQSLLIQYETSKHFFVHAGLDPILGKNTPTDQKLWIREPFLSSANPLQKTIVFGHTPTYRIHPDKSSDIWFGDRKIGIDGGCAYGHFLHALIISENETRYEVQSIDYSHYKYERIPYLGVRRGAVR